MTKSELIALVAEKCTVMTKKQVDSMVNDILACIRTALKHDDKVEIRGFGSFRVRRKNARLGRNPKTGEAINIPALKVPYFKTGKEIKDKLLAD
jgi:integration host factor subunit beta